MNHISHRILDAPAALRRFLDARAVGASRAELKKLSDLAMKEQAERSGKPFLRLAARDGDLTDLPEGS